MRNTLTWIAYGAVVIILIVLVGFNAVNYNTGVHSLSYPYGQSDPDKAEALQVAFNDTLIKNNVLQSGRYNANVAIGGSFDDSGYIGLDGRLALVDISTVSVFSRTFRVLADISTGQEMEARYPYGILNKRDFVLLPGGTTWYHSFMVNESPASIDMEFSPQNAAIYPVIVDQANFDNYMSGRPFEPLGFTDGKTDGIKTYGGSIPVSSLWSVNVTAPGTGSPQKCYLILQNKGRYGDMFLMMNFKDGE